MCAAVDRGGDSKRMVYRPRSVLTKGLTCRKGSARTISHHVLDHGIAELGAFEERMPRRIRSAASFHPK
jgi:hypothetical protein